MSFFVFAFAFKSSLLILNASVPRGSMPTARPPRFGTPKALSR
jgi:hypothetical protein